MCDEAVHERLRRVRLASHASVGAIAEQAGVRLDLLQAIEEGRFHDLPAGIYARSAIRRHAAALGLDPEEILAQCAPLLPGVEDPIAAIGRLRGGAAHPHPEDPTACPVGRAEAVAVPSWRVIAAAAIDAGAMAALLLVVITATVAAGIPVAALSRAAAPAFGLLVGVIGVLYFVVLGGVIGTTAGEYLAGGGMRLVERQKLDLREVSARTLQCLVRDARFIESIGEWVGRSIAGWPRGASGAPHAEPPAA